jgi:hypothetical protein
MNRQLTIATISVAVILLLCSGPVAGRFSKHDGGKMFVFLNRSAY